MRQATLVAAFALVIIGCIFYALALPWPSADAKAWFVPWLNYIIQHGPIASLSQPLPITLEGVHGNANYNPPYLYLLVLGSVASPLFDSLTIVKLVAIAGGLAAAGCMYVLLRTFVDRRGAGLAAIGVMLLPTTYLNSAVWGQSDTYYAAFILLVVAAALRSRWLAMMAAFGGGLAFKLQAVFIAPFVLYVVIANSVPLWMFGGSLFAYCALLVPAILCGAPIWSLLTVYAEQAKAYRWLSMNAPNMWTFIQAARLMSYETGVAVGIGLASIGGLILSLLGLRWKFKREDLLLLATVSATAMPYLLPKMHDRYFFPADLLTYALAVAMPRRWTIAVAAGMQIGSASAYASHFLGNDIGKAVGAVVVTASLASLCYQLLRTAQRNNVVKQSLGEGLPQNHRN